MGTSLTLTQADRAAGASFDSLAAAFDAALAACPSALRQHDYAVGGRVLRIRTNRPELPRLFERSMLAEIDGRAPELTLDLGPGAAAGGPDRETIAVSPDGGQAWYTAPSVVIRHDRARHRAVGRVGPVATLSPWQRTRPHQAMIVQWLTGAGATVLHSAMVSRGGRGVLFAGPNGSGKSTIVAACMRAGLDTLGDDVVAVETQGPAALTGHSLYAVLKLDRGLATAIGPAAAARTYEDPSVDEVVFDLSRSPQMARSAEVVTLALPVLSDRRETRVAIVPRGQALRALIGGHLSAQPARVAGELSRLADLVERVVPVRFEVGRDARGIARAVEALLGGEAG